MTAKRTVRVVACALAAAVLAAAVGIAPAVAESDDDTIRTARAISGPNLAARCGERLSGTIEVDERGCPTAIDPAVGLVFDSDDHRAWYRFFWTGNCGGLTFLQGLVCQGDRATWYGLIEKTLAKVSAKERGKLRFRMFRLGRIMGYEWAAENGTRRIDTDDLSRWGGWLHGTENATRTVTRIFEAVRSREGGG